MTLLEQNGSERLPVWLSANNNQMKSWTVQIDWFYIHMFRNLLEILVDFKNVDDFSVVFLNCSFVDI